MEAVKDEAYMNWWRHNGEMADCDVEYPAWKAGRAYQHQFEKSAQQSFAPDSLKAVVNSLPKSPKTGKPLLAKSG